uniref:Uncharacterized protein n=1 Tax=Heterorhabditis bacteriophora TaxID=37862 RepID=A0A1I7XWB9_HETBA
MVRPQGGAGRGKDMANIIEAEKKRKGSVDSTTDGIVGEGVDRDRTSQMGKPARSAPKPRRKLNDLNIDNRSDSDSEEYKASESEEEEADAEEIDSESDYVPSDEQKRTRRGGARGGLARTQSDDDFVVSGSDDEESDYRGKRKKIVEKKSKKKGRWEPSDSDSEEEESYGYSDDSEADRRRKKKEGAKGRWKARDTSDESDAPRTKTGRPLRRAVAQSETKKVIVSDSEDNEDEGVKEKEVDRPVGPLDKQRKRKIESDSDEEEFKPDEEEAENYEDESEEDEESLEKETEDDSTDVQDLKRKKSSEDDNSNDSNDLDLKPKIKKRKAANDIELPKKVAQKLTTKIEPSDLSEKGNGPGMLYVKKEVPVREVVPPSNVISVKKEFATPTPLIATREVERKPVM